MRLASLLRVTPVVSGDFVGPVVYGGDGVAFGGHLVAHSIVAAAARVADGRSPHSVHTNFLRAAIPDGLVRYEVEIVRTGRSFDVLRVEAWQDSTHVAMSTLSFTSLEAGLEYQEAMPDVGSPQGFEPSTFVPPGTDAGVRGHFDIRDARLCAGTRTRGPSQDTWLRAREPLGPEPSIHAAALAWFSDLSMPWTAELPYADASLTRTGASLDHAMWFHRAFRADSWLLFVQRSPVYAHSRALTSGHFYSADGQLVATAMQETLLRRVAVDH